MGAVAGPMRHPTGLPETHGASVLSKRCLNPCLEDGPRLSSQRSIPLSLAAGWPPPRCALGQPAVFSMCGHGHWRSLPGSAGPVPENWNRVSCSAVSLGDASIFLKEIASVYFRPLRGVGRDAAAPFIVYESIGFVPETPTHFAAAVQHECGLHWCYVLRNWRKYLIKPVNFYTDNKNVSTDINVNKTK